MSETKKKIDKLDRQDYIKFIENLILNSDNYKRDNNSKSYVMALDSAWGTGKSYFIDLLIQDIEEQNNLFVVKYNAWANDYCDNAFNPLIYDILKSDAVVFSTENGADIKNVKNLLASIGKIGWAIGKQVLNKKIKDDYGIEIGNAVDQALASGEHIKSFMFRVSENLEQLNAQRVSFEEFKACLSTATEWMKEEGKKLVVIIDELDRCKPTFAIQTLEIVKHIFDIENIVFLFAVDTEQLSHSVSTIYGQDFDSVGYLCRFFDYISKLPNPKIERFISYKLEEVGFDIQDPQIIKMHNYICELVKIFNLSLRDTDTILQSYKILNDTKLHEYKILGAHFVYLFYLTLKYKKPDVYHEIFIKSVASVETIRQLQKDCRFTDEEMSYVNYSMMYLERNDKLCDKPKDLYKNGDIIFNRIIVNDIQNQTIRFKNDFSTYTLNSFITLDKILFYPDLMRWSEICTYTYKEYIHKQLENYNFMVAESDN